MDSINKLSLALCIGLGGCIYPSVVVAPPVLQFAPPSAYHRAYVIPRHREQGRIQPQTIVIERSEPRSSERKIDELQDRVDAVQVEVDTALERTK